MATETAAPASNRPRPALLALLLIVAMVFVYTQYFSGPAAPASVPTTPARAQGKPTTVADKVEPKDLDVRVETLSQKTPPLGEMERNPFRFGEKAPPPQPAFNGPARPAPKTDYVPPTTPTPPVVDPGPPRIGDTVKFIGVVETSKGKIGAFSIWDSLTRECRGVPSPGKEGDVIEGRYRVVRLGIESAVLEFLDGRGRATLPLNGQACVVK